MIIRNDDVAFDTNLSAFRKFCNLCDQYQMQIIHGITIIGSIQQVSVYWDNAKIMKETGVELWSENERLLEYIFYERRKKDLFAVHGLWHTHAPEITEIKLAKKMLRREGITATYYIPPFNEGLYPEYVDGMKVLNINCHRLETYHDNGTMPTTEIAYLHSWRYENKPYNLNQLEHFFKTITK